MRYERDAITMLVYARNSIDTLHRLKFLRPSFTTYKFYENATSHSIRAKNRPWSELSENQPACKGHRNLLNCKVKMEWFIKNPRFDIKVSTS